MSTTTVKSLLKITAHKAVKFNSVSGQFFFGGGLMEAVVAVADANRV